MIYKERRIAMKMRKEKKFGSSCPCWERKADIELETLAWWLLALIVLAIMLVAFFVLRSKGINAIEFIKNLFRFGK